MLKFEKIKVNDLGQIFQIAKSCFSQSKNLSPRYFERFYLKYPEGFLVAKYNGKIIGYLIYEIILNDSTKIISLAILPDYQRRGIGTYFLNYLFE
ncbi:MAG: GNAT family N-acetyltransferase, partial [Candidatus Margulisiibacteriota bacterium]